VSAKYNSLNVVFPSWLLLVAAVGVGLAFALGEAVIFVCCAVATLLAAGQAKLLTGGVQPVVDASTSAPSIV
jgi:hypothetical protein